MGRKTERIRAWLVGRSGVAFYLTALLVAVVIALNALVYALTDRYQLYLYAPEREGDIISDASELYFERAMIGGRRVEITFCQDEGRLKQHPTGSFVLATAMSLAERHPDFLSVRFVNCITGYDENGEYVDLSKYTEDGKRPITDSSVIFECEGNFRVLTDTMSSAGFSDFFTLTSTGEAYAYNGEEVLASMICWVTEAEHKTVYFTENHGERADISLNSALVCSGFYVDTINLRREEIPEDAALVVISNPTTDFERSAGATAELDRLEKYMQRGGNLYVALDPVVKRLPNLEDYLATKGFELSGGAVESGAIARDIVRDDRNGIPPDGYSFVATPADNGVSEGIFALIEKYTEGRVAVESAAALKLSQGAVPLLQSSPNSVTVRGGEISDTEGSYAIVGYNEITNIDGISHRVIVVPNVSLTSTELMTSDVYVNKGFIISAMSELFGGSSTPIGAHTVLYESTALRDFTLGTARLFTAIIMAVPTALAVVGAVVIIKRKNR